MEEHLGGAEEPVSLDPFYELIIAYINTGGFTESRKLAYWLVWK